MGWMQLVTAILLVGMIIFLYPVAKHHLRNGPKGNTEDWMALVVVLLLVGGFVLFLVSTL